MTTVLLLSTADTDLLAARASGAAYRIGNPARLGAEELLEGADVAVVRLLGGKRAWQGSDAALSPMDAAMQVAIPEFDGRLVTVPFSFKEQGLEGGV